MIHGADRYCIITQGDTHDHFLRNLNAACPPVDVYLRDSQRAQDVRHYMQQVHDLETVCFREPSPRFALAHFGLNGPAMVVTAEVGGEVVAAQYVVWDGHMEGRRGLRFWTTIVHADMRGQRIASTMTAVSTVATQSWAEYGSTICDTSSSLMGRNMRLHPTIVTANMFHTQGRRKVHLEWERPVNPFVTLFERPQASAYRDVTTLVHSLQMYDPAQPLPERFYVPADAQVWEDIADSPEHYRRRFQLVGWVAETGGSILADTRVRREVLEPVQQPQVLEMERSDNLVQI